MPCQVFLTFAIIVTAYFNNSQLRWSYMDIGEQLPLTNPCFHIILLLVVAPLLLLRLWKIKFRGESYIFTLGVTTGFSLKISPISNNQRVVTAILVVDFVDY